MEQEYDHYIAVDWALANMAIARMTKRSNKITVVEAPADLSDLQAYLKILRGTKILVLEETTTSQWIYTEIRDSVNRILICDPHRNRLLEEGPKTDKIDATKLVRLLRADLLKEVFHSADEFVYLRKLAGGYDDMVQAGVRFKNQRYSLLRACGLTGQEKKGVVLKNSESQFVLDGLEKQIAAYEEEKKRYEKEFEKLARIHPAIKHQTSLPGIGPIGAVKIVARVVSPGRFPTAGHFLSYVGLVKLEKRSGGMSYGRKQPRFCRQLKAVYKTCTQAALGNNNPINDCYEYLIREKGYSEYNARHKVCRRLATLSLGVFKSGRKYQPFERKETVSSQT